MKRYIKRFTRWVRQMDKVEKICWIIAWIIALIVSVIFFLEALEAMHWLLALLISVVICPFATWECFFVILLLLCGLEMLWEWIYKKLRR